MNLIIKPQPSSIIKLLFSSIILAFTLFFLIFNTHPTSAIPAFLSLQQTTNGDNSPIYSSHQSLSLHLTLHSNLSSSSAFLPSTTPDSSDLDPLDVDRRILNAAPILGFYQQSNGELADWMASIPDDTLITRMNIPGTHDSATWNYTRQTQKALEPITGKLPPSIAFQCQDRSLFEMLGDGIRFFDLRVGFLPDHDQIGFYHASAMLSSTATLPDVLLGFYKWLDDHPSETVLISIKVDNATFQKPPSKKQPSSLKLQEKIYQLLTQSDLGRSHWLQEDSKLGTLGESRGKLIFIQRIDWEYIRNDPTLKPIGIPLPPSKFNVNDANFTITYGDQEGANQTSKVFIEDYYNLLPNPTTVKRKVDMKFNVVEKHFELAASADNNDGQDIDPDLRNSLFITFTSGGALTNIPPVTPKRLAIGSGKGKISSNSVNAKLLDLFQNKYKINNDSERTSSVRLGVVVFDWYHGLPSLIHDFISLNPSNSFE